MSAVSICYPNGSGGQGAVTTVFATHITLGINVQGDPSSAPPFEGSANSYQLYMYDANGTLLATFNDWPTYGANNSSAANPEMVNGYTATWLNTGDTGTGYSGFNIDVAGLRFATAYQFSIGCVGEAWTPTSPITIWTAPIWVVDRWTDLVGDTLYLNLKFFLAEYFWDIPVDINGSAYNLSVTDQTKASASLCNFTASPMGTDLSVLTNPITTEERSGNAIPLTNAFSEGGFDGDDLQLSITWNPDPSYTGAPYDTSAATQTFDMNACLGADTHITLADGSTKAIQDLSTADVVASHAGATLRVEGVLSCVVKHADVYVIPRGTYGATADLLLSRAHGFWASWDEYASRAPPRVPYRDAGCKAYTPPPTRTAEESTSGGAGAGALSASESGCFTMHNVQLAGGGVMVANGVCVVGML